AGIRAIGKLEIEKQAKAPIDPATHRLGPCDHEQFLAHLQGAGTRVEPVDKRHRLRRIGEVERNDDARIRGIHLDIGIFATAIVTDSSIPPQSAQRTQSEKLSIPTLRLCQLSSLR